MRVTITPGFKRALELFESDDETIEELSGLLSDYEIGTKDGTALIPARFRPCPDRCAGKGELNCGGDALHRLSANVVSMTGLGLDFDALTEAQEKATIEHLVSTGLRFWAWETFGHKGGADCRFRVLIPFYEELPISAPSQWSRVAWPALVRSLRLPVECVSDVVCKDAARIYYLPRKPSAADEREAGYQDGRALDWRAVLGDSLERATVTAAKAPPRQEEDPSRPVDLLSVRERLKAVTHTAHAPLIVKVLKAVAPTPPPEKRTPGERSRYAAWRDVTGVLAMVAEEWESSEALLEIIRPAWQAEVAESPNDHTDFATIETLFESARNGAPAEKARVEAERKAAIEVFRRGLRQATGGARVESRPQGQSEGGARGESRAVGAPATGGEEGATATLALEASNAADTAAPLLAAPSSAGPLLGQDDSTEPSTAPQEVDWTEGLKVETRGGQIKVVREASNIAHVFRYHPDWIGALRKNEVSGEVEVWRGPLLQDGERPGRPLCDADAVRAADWVSMTPNLGWQPADAAAWVRLLSVGEDAAYDPLKDYLNGVEHDGRARLSTWLIDYLGAAEVDTDGKDLRPHLATIGPKWLVSAVARGLNPGAQVDSVLVLEGGQGSGKTSAVRALAGQWGTEQPIKFDSKDSEQILASSWIVELAELEALRKSDTATQRAFLTRMTDQFRSPYGRVAKKHPRRCVFIGSTNHDDYLQDETGNRRWWPVWCPGEIQLEALRRDRDQIWAEAVALYKAGAQWHLTREETKVNAAQTEARMASDPIADKIEDYVRMQRPESRKRHLTTLQIIEDILGETASKGLEMKVARAMTRLKAKKTTVGEERKRVYALPAALLAAEGMSTARKVGASHLRPVKKEEGT